MRSEVLAPHFFDRDASEVAVGLLGAIIERHVAGLTLRAMIVETESYYARDRGSHASLGRTPSRAALFMPPGTIYMYYARGGDSLNFSCRGEGDAVLIKAALPVDNDAAALARMHANNPRRDGGMRPLARLASGQTLLCRALELRVPELDGRALPLPEFTLLAPLHDEVTLIQTTRLGIPTGRHEELWQRFVLAEHAGSCTRNPLTVRAWREGEHYALHEGRQFSREKTLWSAGSLP